MLARLFVFFGGLFVLVLLAALVVPHFVDWTSYRADFEREASAILGRRVTVRGTATATLLPFPSVTFSDVSVAGGPGGEPAMTVETFSMDAELAPFLSGEVLIFDMRLVRPKAVVNVDDEGAVDWTVRPSTPFDPGHITIERLTVSEGQIEVRHAAAGRSHLISEINTTVSAKSVEGPWRLDGSMRFDGLRSQVSASTGRPDEAGKLRVRLKIDPDIYPLTLETDGDAGIKNGAMVYAGQFKIAGADRNTTVMHDGEGGAIKVSTGAPDPGYRLSGKFALDHRRLAVDEFRFATGPLNDPYTADGKATVDLGGDPRFAIEANGTQVQFDEAVGAGQGGGLTLEKRLAALEEVLLDLPRPTMPGTVEFNLPAVVAGDTTIRDVKISAEPAEGGWALKSLAATLPGRTRLEAEGRLGVDNGLDFNGSLLVAVGQPSGFAAWLAKDVDEAVRRMPAAGFHAKVALSNARQSFNELELVLGTAKFKGHVESRTPQDAKPSVAVQLFGGALDLEGLRAFASLFVSDGGENRFSDRDLDFDLKAGPVTVAGLTADTVDAGLRLRQGSLEIDRLSIGGLAGASVSATGRIKDFPQSPTGNLDASLVAVDLEPLAAAAAAYYPDSALLAGLARRAAAFPDLLQDARIDLVASAARNGDGTTGTAISAQGEAGGTSFSATLSGQGTPDRLDEASVTATFNAKNSDATVLLALYGVPVAPLGLVGEGTTDLSASGTLAGGLKTSFELTGPAFRTAFEGTIEDGQQGPALKGRVNLDAADIEPWMMTAGLGLPGMGTGTAAAFRSNLDYANGLAVLNDFSGTVNETSISGDINASLKDGLPQLSGALEMDELDLDPVAVMLFGAPAFEGSGEGWPTTPFAPKPSLPFSAELDLSVASLVAGAFATVSDASLSLGLDREGLRVGGLRGDLYGGKLEGLAELKNNDGTGLFSGQFKLLDADIGTALGDDAGLSGRGDVSTQLTSSGKSVDALIAALSGSGTASLKGLSIGSVNPDALPALIKQADAIGRDIDAARTADFAPAILADGTFSPRDAEVAFTVAGGVVRMPPLSLEGDNASITADISADVGGLTISANGSVAYQAGDEALVGSEPAVNFSVQGPLGATERSFDTAPLAQFLTQRALEKEQQRVEAMQAVLLEKQRLRREVRYYALLQAAREKADELRRQEEARRQAEAEAAAKAEEQARLEAEAKAQADADAKAQAEADALARAAAEAAHAEAERQAAERAMKLAEEEKARAKALQPDQQIERTPLPPPSTGSTPPKPKPAAPFTIDSILKALE